jgi:carboxylesterase type B
MSGPPGTALNMSSDATTLHTIAVAENVGCTQNGGEQLECLRAVPMEKLLDAAIAYSVANHPPAGLFTFIPSVDGDFFPDRQSVLYRRGLFVKGKYIPNNLQHSSNSLIQVSQLFSDGPRMTEL